MAWSSRVGAEVLVLVEVAAARHTGMVELLGYGCVTRPEVRSLDRLSVDGE